MGFGSNGNNGSSQGSGSKKFFCDVVKISRAQGYRKEKHKGGFMVDLGVEVFWSVQKKDGGSFEKSILISVREANIEKMGWLIDRLWNVAGASSDWMPTEEGRIPEEALRDLLNRQIKVLRYPDTKGYHSEWDRPFRATDSDEDMKAEFLSNYEQRGYPKNYSPGGAIASGDPVVNAIQEEFLPF